MNALRLDLRYAVRWLIRNPGFTAVAVATLAIGIGANTAIFSFVDGVLLRPLPYSRPGELVSVWETMERPGRVDDGVVVAYPNFRDWRDQSRSFERLAAYSDWSFNLTGREVPERISSAIVSASFFDVLRVKPLVGRTFAPNEDQPGHDAVVVLGRGLWAARFGSDPRAIGQSVTLDGESLTVIGIVDDAVRLPGLEPRLQVFVPVSHGFGLENRRAHYLSVIGRLAPGRSLPAARSEMSAIAAGLAARYPQSNTGHGASVIAAREQMVGEVRPALLAMLAAVLLVLLIAAANVANMMLARASTREREIAIRVALGANRRRILRQLLTESVLISLCGGLLGLGLAFWGVDLLKSLAPPDIPRLPDVRVDATVAAFALLLSGAAGILFGLAPAWHTARTAFAASLKDRGARSLDRRSSRLRGLLVIAEFALSLTLVTGAGLLLKSFLHLQNVPLGFEPARSLTFSLDLPDARYPTHAARSLFQSRLLARVERLPGVESAATVTNLPLLSDREANLSFLLEGRPADPANVTTARFNEVSPGYFNLLRIPVLRGRIFGPGDIDGSPRVVVINQAMASRHFASQDPIGRRITLSDDPKPGDWMTIVGIVGDVRDSSPSQAAGAQMYMAYAQHPQSGMTVLVRSPRERQSLLADLRAQVAALDPQQPIYSIQTFDEVTSASLGQPRFRTALIGIFGLVALLLAAVGIYGVMAYSVSQRTQEIGIRMALGAAASDVWKLLFQQAVRLAGIALAAGIAGALVVSRLLSRLLYGVEPTDPATFLAVSLVLLAVGGLAAFVPARRATRIDPTIALRQE